MEWTIYEWSERSWLEDPWAVHLDAARPSWRRYYSNWESGDPEERFSARPPEDSGVPFPRLLSRRENSPAEERKAMVMPRRAQFSDVGEHPEGPDRRLLRDQPQEPEVRIGDF